VLAILYACADPAKVSVLLLPPLPVQQPPVHHQCKTIKHESCEQLINSPEICARCCAWRHALELQPPVLPAIAETTCHLLTFLALKAVWTRVPDARSLVHSANLSCDGRVTLFSNGHRSELLQQSVAHHAGADHSEIWQKVLPL
jgi:hypothetical protein